MVFFHRNIVCFRTVIEEMVKITIPVVVIGTLAIILLIVLIYLRRKNGNIFCEKPFQKGNSYLKLHCPIFLAIPVSNDFVYKPIIGEIYRLSLFSPAGSIFFQSLKYSK